MDTSIDEIVIKGITYVPKGTEYQAAERLNDMPYVMARTQSAGVFAGYLQTRSGQEVVLRKARRIWYWKGAASLSQLATEGTSEPLSCQFPCEVDRVELLQTIEIIDVTEKAKKSIASVPIWKK